MIRRCAIAYTQDPDNWRDYTNQVYRWTLGYWQTIRVHMRHFGKFWMAVAMQATETIMSVVTMICLMPAMPAHHIHRHAGRHLRDIPW